VLSITVEIQHFSCISHSLYALNRQGLIWQPLLPSILSAAGARRAVARGYAAMFSSYPGLTIQILHNLSGSYIGKPKKGAHYS